jgi:regulation of enolase protein 1 (concanavalin A-like superfamily)
MQSDLGCHQAAACFGDLDYNRHSMPSGDETPVQFGARELTWLHPPPWFSLEAEQLLLETAPGTDFWQRTHYGFQFDNGHALLTPVEGDFQVETEVEFHPVHQYDQAGLLVRISESCWLKTSVEYELDAPSRLGSVVTNQGWSDWATQNVPAWLRSARFRITRRAGDYVIEHGETDGLWTQLRVARLHDDHGTQPVSVGIYACSPRGGGFKARFRSLRIENV